MKKSILCRTCQYATIILLICYLGILSSCNTKKDAPEQKNIEETILSLERQALDKWSAGDPSGFPKNFADDATYFDDIGAMMRIDSIGEIEKYFASLDGNIPPHNYKIVEPKVQVYDDIAILTLRYYATSKEGEPGPPWKATSVYRLNAGEWRVVHANWSLIKEE